MSGDVAELLVSVADAGLTLIPAGDRLRVRGPEPMPAQLLDELRRSKPAILTHLREQAERHRQSEAWAVGDRLADLYQRSGSPADWLTPPAEMAESEVEWFWCEARRTGDDAAFLVALQQWEVLTAEAIRTAARLQGVEDR